MAVTFKKALVADAGVSKTSDGYSMTIGYMVSGFAQSGSDRLIEALSASGSVGAIPAIGDAYTGSLNLSGSVVDSINVDPVGHGDAMRVLVNYVPDDSSRSYQAERATTGVITNGSTTLTQRPKSTDAAGDKIALVYIPPGENVDADDPNFRENVTIPFLDASRIRDYEFTTSGNPENMAFNTVGKCDPGDGEGSSTYHQWIGWSMDYTKLAGGKWRVKFQAAHRSEGWDGYRLFINSNGKIPANIDLEQNGGGDSLARPQRIGTDAYDGGANGVNGAVRPTMYYDWDLSGFPAEISGDF